MKGTYLEINLTKIEENAGRIVDKCAGAGIQVLGVTKGFSALHAHCLGDGPRWDKQPGRFAPGKYHVSPEAAFCQQA